MPNELNITLSTGLTTVTARLIQAGAYVGSAIALNESPASSGFYTGNVPGGTSAGTYEVLFLSSGATAGSGRLFWDGTAEVDTRTVNTNVTTLTGRLTSDRAGYLDKLNVSGTLANTANADTFKADVSGLSTLNQSGVQSALTAQGYTSTRAPYLDKLNVAGTLANTSNADSFKATGFSTLDGAGVQSALTAQGLTSARAAYLDKLNVTGAIANTANADTFKADVSGLSTLDSAGVQSALTSQGLTTARAGYLDKLNVTGTLANTSNADSFKATGFSTLDGTGVQNALTAQGLTTARVAYLDKLNITGTLANTDNAATFRADLTATNTAITNLSTQLTTLVPSGAIIRIDTYVSKRSDIEGFTAGVSADFAAPADTSTPGYIRTSNDSVNVDIIQVSDTVRRTQPSV